MINNIWQKSVCYGCSDAHHRWLHLRGRRHPGFSTHSFLIFWVPELHSTTSVKLTWNIIQDGGWTGVSPVQEGIHTSCRGSLPRSWASMAFTTSGILFAAPSPLSIPLGDISEQNELTLKWGKHCRAENTTWGTDAISTRLQRHLAVKNCPRPSKSQPQVLQNSCISCSGAWDPNGLYFQHHTRRLGETPQIYRFFFTRFLLAILEINNTGCCLKPNIKTWYLVVRKNMYLAFAGKVIRFAFVYGVCDHAGQKVPLAAAAT